MEPKEQDLVCNLLLSMPKTFETLITVLESMSEEELTLEVVKTRLRSEVERRGVSSSTQNIHTPISSAFTSTQYGTCHFCKQRGHFKKECRKYLQQKDQATGDYNNYNRLRKNFNQGNSRGRSSYRGRGSYRSNHSFSERQDRDGNYVEHESTNQEEANENEVCFMVDTNVINHSNTNVINHINMIGDNELLFYIDSGCTDHLVNDKKYFSELLMLKNPIKIAVAKSNNYMEAIGVGEIKAISFVDGKEVKCTIKNVLFVPNLRKNLLSVKRLEMSDVTVVFENGQVLLFDNNKLLGIGCRNNLYEISFKVCNQECMSIETENETVKLWHRRYGRIGYSNLEKLIKKNMFQGIENVKTVGKFEFCEACVGGKMSRLKFGTRTKAKRVLEIIHSDVVGPVSPLAHDGSQYFVQFIDDYSKFTCVYLMKQKNEVDYFKEYVQMVETKFNSKISVLRCDNGKEYIPYDLQEFCKRNGIIIDYTCPYTPEQNSKAERHNRTVVEKARALCWQMLICSKYFGVKLLGRLLIL